MLPSLTKLYHVTSEWSDSELSLLLSALKRDRSFSTRELAEFIQTKNKTEIRELMACLMDVDEKNLQDPQITVPEVKPEGSIDILLQITRHSCTEYYNYSMALIEVLQRASTWESVECRKINKRDPDPIYLPYAQVYRFFSSLVCGKPLPNLSDLSSGAFLDLLTCLDRILSFVNNSKKSENSNHNPRLLVDQLQNANKIATEKIGVFLALAAAIQLNSRLCSRRGCGITEKFDEHCIAPLFLLSKVKHPNTLKQTREMVEYLINRFVKLWSLPKFPCSQNGSFASEGELNIQSTDIPDALFKRLSIFSLNPFSFPMEVMSPFQKILDDFRHMCSSRFNYLNRFKSMLYISLPIGLQHSVKRSSPSQPIKVVNQWKKRRIEKSSTKSRPTIRRRKALESSVPLDNLITLSFDENTNQVDSNACSDEKTDLKVNLTSRRFVNWCPGTHFIRVSDPAEDEAVKILMNKVKKLTHHRIYGYY
ncbi:unnamed protein product [Schistosoma rodhaini]|uniref:Uncharacterized protein n=1 Tax=Schistosoma rodhaini TaxID=6188 RepID=A0AA85EZ38_9TREM|nr:unnamed protein product [Schistosoma rodhaini]CAH8662570.1 unnamed protein product [Schistosoma rodhaini]